MCLGLGPDIRTLHKPKDVKNNSWFHFLHQSRVPLSNNLFSVQLINDVQTVHHVSQIIPPTICRRISDNSFLCVLLYVVTTTRKNNEISKSTVNKEGFVSCAMYLLICTLDNFPPVWIYYPLLPSRISGANWAWCGHKNRPPTAAVLPDTFHLKSDKLSCNDFNILRMHSFPQSEHQLKGLIFRKHMGSTEIVD